MNVTSVSGNEKYAVLCCSNSGETCYTPQPCITFTLKRFEEAKEACEENGNRLCTEKEINSRDCCGSECEFDVKKVWLADEGGENVLIS